MDIFSHAMRTISLCKAKIENEIEEKQEQQ